MPNEIIGTPFDDVLDGTSGDDIIFGLEGDDLINAGAGDDIIHPGPGNDRVFAGAGNDTIVYGTPADIANDRIDGGSGTNTLVIDLFPGGSLGGLNASSLGDAPNVGIGGMSFFAANIQQVQVSNGSNVMLTVGTAAPFAFDGAATSTDFQPGTYTLEGASFDGNEITVDTLTFDKDAGVQVGGVTHGDGDSFALASGGMVEVSWQSGSWGFTYTAPGDGELSEIVLGTTTVDEAIVATATVAGATDTVDVTVSFAYAFDQVIDLRPGTLTADGINAGVRIVGSDDDNTVYSGNGNDLILMNGGTNSVVLFGGTNQVWAGPGQDDSSNFVSIHSTGMNQVGTGAGIDTIFVEATATGDNSIFAGAGNDFVRIADGADGNNTVWAGDGQDAIQVHGHGNNILGGGDGDDVILIFGHGDNTVYGGTGSDRITISGDGDNLVLGGGLNPDGSMTNNLIIISGDGANEVFNGQGNDTVMITGAGDNLLWGGAGNDEFDFAAGSAGTVKFEPGNGNDTITGDILADGIFIDLSAIYDSASDVFADMTDDGQILVAPGQVIDIADHDRTALFQNADDWLIV